MKENWENHWKDYYQILQVHQSAEPEVITAAYKKLLDKYHPDHNHGKEQWATEKSKEINNAYEVLNDPIKRREYDAEWRKRMAKNDDSPEDNNEDFVPRSPYSQQPINESRNSSSGRGGTLLKIAIPLFIISLLCTVLIYFHITSENILPAQVLTIPQYPTMPTTTQPVQSIPAFVTLPFNVNEVIREGGTPNYITIFVTPNSVTQSNTEYGIQLNNRSTGTFRAQVDAAWSPVDIQNNKQLALVVEATQDEINSNPIITAYWNGVSLSARSYDFSVNYTFSLATINNLTEQQTIAQDNQQLNQQYQQELAQYQEQYSSISAQQQSIKAQQNILNNQYSQKLSNRNSEANKILYIFIPIDVILLIAIIYAAINTKSSERPKKEFKRATNSEEETFKNSSPFSEQGNSANNEPTLVETIVKYIKQFHPNWQQKNGKTILEGGENGNNANLAVHLRKYGLTVETEGILKNRSRADLVINGEVVLECKPQLKSTDTLHTLAGEVKRARKLLSYKVLALIYGDARNDLYKELCDEIGESNVILLGELRDN